jgi:hypothetical protein
MTVFPPDPRRYQLVTPPHEKRRFAHCLATTPTAGESIRCSYQVRLDHLREAISNGRLHTCRFPATQRPLDDLLARNLEQESAVWNLVANLAACHNLSLQTATSPEFRYLLEPLFQAGYRQGQANDQRGDSALAFFRHWPPCKATSLRKPILTVSSQATKSEERLFSDLTFVSMTMDARQIGTTKLFVTNLVASNVGHCFTHSITKIDRVDHNVLADMLRAVLLPLHDRGIRVGTITCDRASYQVKALTFGDPESVQKQNPEVRLLSRLLFIPCLCH